MNRYARQIAVIGEAGQARIGALDVEVVGSDLAAEICALYLAGAGVRRLSVDRSLLASVAAINSEVEVVSSLDGAMRIAPEGSDPVLAGSRAARKVLALALRGSV